MKLYKNYINEIESRKKLSLKPKPIDDGNLLKEIITEIININSKHRKDCLNFLIFNTLPGTTSAAKQKSKFLKDIIVGVTNIKEISIDFAFELLSHMKGGPSVKVLLDILFSDNVANSKKALNVLKNQVFLYDTDTDRIKEAYIKGNENAKNLLESYSKAEYFTNLPEIKEEIEVVTYVAAEGDISTDLLSPGNQAHSRSDRELHGKCMISENA